MKDIRDLKNIHKGKECVIIGNGTSLTESVINKIKDKKTIGCNGIIFAKDKWGFVPDYITMSDKYWLKPEIWSKFEKSESTIVMSRFILEDMANYHMPIEIEQMAFLDDNVYMVNAINTPVIGNDRLKSFKDISFDLSKGTYVCGTVIQDISIPLSVWLGFKTIYLVGCDCSLDGHWYGGPGGGIGIRKQLQYKLFRKRLDELGIDIYNLSPIPDSCPGLKKRGIDDIHI